MEKARKIDDPELRKMVENDVKERWNDDQAVERERHSAILRAVTNLVEKTQDIKLIPPDVWANELSIQERKTLEAYAEQLKRGIDPETDRDIRLTLLKGAVGTEEERRKFLETDLDQYRTILSKKDFDMFLKLQGDIRKGDERAKSKTFRVVSEEEEMNEKLKGLGIIPQRRTLSDEETNRRAYVAGEVTARVNALTQGKRGATPEEYTKILNDVVTEEVFRPRGFFGLVLTRQPFSGLNPVVGKKIVELSESERTEVLRLKRAFEEKKRLKTMKVDEIPKDDLEDIRKDLKRVGLKETDDRLTALYRAMKENNAAEAQRILSEKD